MGNLEKFQSLLENLFQFEASDLDFGIYRILNYKRSKIETFIREDLKSRAEVAFSKHKTERQEAINQSFEEIRQKVVQSLGDQAVTPSGDLKKEFENTPLGKEFLEIKARKDEAQAIDEIQSQVFNDLYNFFSRYYEDGDFVPQYRYSIKGHKYAIPYNGEEVKLYWANYEQYYTKTGLLFRDYTFKADNIKVIFRIVSAREEVGSKKATKERFFVLDDENTIEITQENSLIIRFQYRELNEEEVRAYQVEAGSNTSKQEKVNQKSYDKVIDGINNSQIKAFLMKIYKNDKPLLLYQLNRFCSKNSRDYFIHKNLKRFLSEQLDYFIKSEVLSIETLEKEKFLDKHITRAKVVKEIGEDIIDFLSQIEDFQKKLWEKKKFVLKTEYVISLDKIKDYAGENSLKEVIGYILMAQKQLKEWEELGFGNVEKEDDLILKRDLTGTEYKKLPIDTKHFNQEFKEKLLEKLTENNDLDNILDGLLIKSENWQALNLILEKYKEKIQTIYIDPPFNTGQDFLYKDKYQDSSWLTLIENRVLLSRNFLEDKGSIYLHLDSNADYFGKILLDRIFGKQNFRIKITWKRHTGPKIQSLHFPNISDFILVFSNKEDRWIYKPQYLPYKKDYLKKMYRYQDEKGIYRIHDLYAPGEGPARLFKGKEINPPKGHHWGYTQDKIDQMIEEGTIFFDERGFPKLKVYLGKGEQISNIWTDINVIQGSASEFFDFQTQKPERLLSRVIESSTDMHGFVLDYFLGSGTTMATAQKLDRKWIGIEMGEYFKEFYCGDGGKRTGILGRMKEVLAGKGNHEPCGISKDVNWQGGGFFKYQVLEQYEDALDNIELKENDQAGLKFGDDYLLKYFLDFETRDSPYLLNIEHLKNPFGYKLKVNLEEVGEPEETIVDVPETFNYLLGLKVKKIKTRDNHRKYLFILGEKDGKDIAVVWRPYEDTWSDDDLKKDKEFIIDELETWAPHIVYINGQSILTPKLGQHPAEIRYIEPEFKKLMER
ncbi:MAG: site-specific DNA-methyltransferase [Candidatus Saccharicenans sp.]|nr:site-specific DNA-methyltransferase [Candidatus Saccharicenans sp.]